MGAALEFRSLAQKFPPPGKVDPSTPVGPLQRLKKQL